MRCNDLVRLLIFVGTLCIATLLTAQNAPVPPATSYLSPVLITEIPDSTVTADAHPLSGGQSLGIGSWGPSHSFLVPSLRVVETLDSNPLLLDSSSGGYKGFTDLVGNVQLLQNLGQSAELRYSGALRFDTIARVQGYSQFTNVHSAELAKSVRHKSLKFLLDDEFQYSQNSSLGAAGMEGLGAMVTQASQWNGLSNLQLGSISLRPDILPDQSILTERAGRVANTALIELDANLHRRDTLTLAASYGLLHFFSSELTDSQQAQVIGGYNRLLTSRDSVALEGAFARYDYQGSVGSISTEYLSALYARRISGRSSIEVGAGPQFTQSLILHVNSQYLGWQARGSVHYRLRRLNLSAQGSRSITGGAGVFDGATTSIGQASADSVLSRYTSMSFAFGVSRNQDLESPQRYNTQFLRVAVNRKVSRYTNGFLSYDLEHQTTASGCTGLTCANTGLRNVFGLGFSWNYRPISVE